jgi:DNA-binding MarR family transcriptional regulator
LDIKPNELFGFIVEDLSRQMRRRFEKAFRGSKDSRGLSRGEARVLASIFVNPGITNSALAERLDIQKISLTHVVNTLETDGLVERRADPGDRRKRLLFITPKAEPIIDQIWDVLSEIGKEIISVLPPERAATFIEDLMAVRDFLMEKPSGQKNNK